MSNKIERFEDFIAWQKARKLTSNIYKISDVGKFARDFGLKDQIRRAGVSVMSNIAEGFERGRPTEFHQFLSIAKGSMGEAIKVGQIIGGLRASVERRRNSLRV